jgi:hypothetical protein
MFMIYHTSFSASEQNFCEAGLSLSGALPCYIPCGAFVIHAVCSSWAGFVFVAEDLEIIQCPLYHTIIAV